uniref:WXG100-like domain-containing protein n=1 Tax=Cumulibacter manganitolerans TaxID=1884992 RepID=UPI001294F9FA
MPEHPNDEQMAWAVLDLPDWANEIVSWVAGGQSWPQGSETMLEELGSHWEELAAALETATTDYAQAATTLSGGWEGPSFQQFYNFAEAAFFKMDGGLPVMATMAGQYAQQARGFATEVNYAKISINIAFYIAVIAAFISLLAAFFTGGGSLVIGAGIREALVAAIRLAMQKLLTAAGRTFVQDVVKKMVVREVAVTARRSAVREVVTRVGHEVVEEVAEEVFIDAATQTIQMQQGHRTSYDYNRTIAAGIGGGIGGLVGSALSHPLSRVARPGNAVGRHLTNLALSAGTNVIASPTGSFMANGLVYGNWNLAAAFTPQALLGAATTAAGRYNTASPFSPDTIADLRRATTHFAADATGLTAPSVTPSMPSPISTAPSTQPGSQGAGQSTGTNGSQPGSRDGAQPSVQAGSQNASQAGSQADVQSSNPGSQTSGQPGTQSASHDGAQSAPQPGGQTEASSSSQTQGSPTGQSDPTSTVRDGSETQSQSGGQQNPQGGPQGTHAEAQATTPSTAPTASPSPDQAGSPSTSTAPSAETAASPDVPASSQSADEVADSASAAEDGSVAQEGSSSLPGEAAAPTSSAAPASSTETAAGSLGTARAVDGSAAQQQSSGPGHAPGAPGPSDAQRSLRSRIAAFVSPAVAFNVPVVPAEARLAAASVAAGSFDTRGVTLGATQISAAFRHTFADGSSVTRGGSEAVDAARGAYARVMSGDATQADVDLLAHQVVEATALQHLTAQPSPPASTPAQEADRTERHRRDATAIAEQVAPGISRADVVGEGARTPAPLATSPQATTDPSTESAPARSSIPAGAANQDIPSEAERATAELAERGRLMIAALSDDHIRIATTLRGQVVPTASGTAPVTTTMIQNIKHHLFSDRAVEHTLDGEPVPLPFAGDADIAEAWLRMATGDISRLGADLQLIAHENAELEGMQRGLSQAEAHEAATATADWASMVPDTGHPLLTAMDAAGGVIDEGSYSTDPVRSLEHSLATSAFARVDDAHPGLEQILTDRSVRPDRRMARDIAAARELHRTHAAAAADSRAQAARLTAQAEQQADSRRISDLQSSARDAHAAAHASQALANDYEAAASQLQTDLDAAIEHRGAQLERAIVLIGAAGVLEMLGNPHLPAGSTTPSSGRGRDTHPSVLSSFRQHALTRIGADLGVDLSGASNRQQRVTLITAHLSALADPAPENATPDRLAAHAQAQSRLVEQVAAALTTHAELDPTHDDHRSIANRIFEHARMLFLEAHAELDTRPDAGRAHGRLEFRWTEMGGTPGSTALELEHTGLPVGITHPLGTGTAAANLDGMRGRNGLELKDGYANLLEDGEFPPREARDLANQFAREVAALDGRLRHEAQQIADTHARSRLGEAGHTVATAPPELRRQILAERNAVRAGFLAEHRPHLEVVSSHPDARAAFQTLVDRDSRLTGHVTVHSSEEHRALMREEVEQGLRARYPGIVEDAAAIIEERIRRGGLPPFMAPAAPPAPASTAPSSPQLYEHGLTTDPDHPGALDHDTLAGLIDGTLTGAGPRGPRPVTEQLSRALGLRITHDTAPDGTATLLAEGSTRSLSIRITTQPTTPAGTAPSMDDDVAVTRIVDVPGMRGRGAEEVIEAVVDITLSANLSPSDVAVVLAQEIARTSAELEPDAINNTEDLLTDVLGKQVPALISQRATDTDASFSPRDVGRLAGLQVRFDALADLSETARGPARRLVDAELTALGLDLSIAAGEDGMPDPDVRQQFFARLQGIPDLDGTSRLKDAIRSFNTNEKGIVPDAPPPVRAFLVKALAAQSVPAAAVVGTAAVVGSSAAMLPVLVATAVGGAIATAASVIADVRKFRSAAANTRAANDGNPRTTDQDRQARRLELEGHEARTATAEVGGRPDERFGPDADRLRRALSQAHARLAARHDAEVARQDPVRGRDLDALDKIADASAVRFKAMSSGLARALAFGAAPIADVVADHTAIDLLPLTGTQSAALTVAAVGNLVAAAIGGGLLGRLGLTGDPGLDVRKAETENRIQSQKAGVQQAATDAAAQDAYHAQSAQIARLDKRADEQSADADRVGQIAAELRKPDRDHTALRTELAQIAARAAAPIAAEESARRALDTARLEQALDRLIDATERVVAAPLTRRLNPFRSLRREIRLAMADVDDATALLEKEYGVRIATSLDEIANSPDRAEAVRVLQSLEASLQKRLSVLQTHPENGARVTATLGRYSSGRYSAGGASTLATRIASGMLATGGLTGTSVGTALFAAASATLAGSSGERSIEIANELRKFYDRFGRPDKQRSLVAVNDGTRPGLVRDEIVDLVHARDLEILARVADADPGGPLGSTPDAGAGVDPGDDPRVAAPSASVAPAAPSGEADVASSAAEDPALRRVSSRLSYVARFMTAPVVTAIGDLVGGRPVFSTLAAAAASLGVGPAEWSGKLAEERAPKILEEIQSTLQSDERAAQDVRHQVHRDTPQVDRTPRQQMETLSRSLRELAREDDRVRARATRRAADLRMMLDVATPALATEHDPAVHRAVADIREAVQDALAAGQGTPSAGEVLRTVQHRRATDRPEDIVAFQRSHLAAARARIEHTSPVTRVLDVRVDALTDLAHRAIASSVNRGGAVTTSATADLDLLRADLDATTTRLRELAATHGERRAAIDEALGAVGRVRQHAAAATEHLARAETLVQRAARHLAGAHGDRTVDAIKVLHSRTFRSGLGPEIEAAQQALDQGRAALREADLVLPRAEAEDLLTAMRDAAESTRSLAGAPLAHAARVTGSAGGDIDTGGTDDTVRRITRSLAEIDRVLADAERAAEHLAGDSGLSPRTILEVIRSAQTELAGHQDSVLDDLAVLERHTAVALAQDTAQRSAAVHDAARLAAERAAQA